MKKNAIILAAGKSNRFAPFTYERPKGLFRVKGEILIERQIEQLKSAGVKEIIVVIGYMKEKFFYLEKKYGVKLIINNEFSEKGNLLSIYKAKKYLKNTYICCADHYFTQNPFLYTNDLNISYRECSYYNNKKRKFVVEYSDANVITGFKIDSNENIAMVGHAYFNEKFSNLFCKYMENEIDEFGVASMFWEQFYAKHIKELTLYTKIINKNDVLEFDSIDNLRQFDSEFLLNIDSDIISNICSTLNCSANEIMEINVIQAGLTNVSFSFKVKEKKYVYRHPGGTAGKLVNRMSEIYAQEKARELGIDKSYIYMSKEDGWKISYYVEDLVECDFLNNENQLNKAMEYLRKIHSTTYDNTVKEFNDIEEGKKLMKIASLTKGKLFEEFAEIINKIDTLNDYVEKDSKQMKIKKVLCHNDTYEPNYLLNQKGELYLIDWEYAGINDPANDIACILCRADYSKEEIEKYLQAYYGRKLTKEEHRHCIAYIAICGFYWFCWGLYKGSVGDDDGFFFLPAYKNCLKYVDIALDSYKNDI